MREKDNNVAVLQNIHSTVLTQIIKYIYTGQATLTGTSKVKQILEAADELMLHGLKSLCEQNLLKDLNVYNAIRMLSIADMFNAKELERESLQLITK